MDFTEEKKISGVGTSFQPSFGKGNSSFLAIHPWGFWLVHVNVDVPQVCHCK